MRKIGRFIEWLFFLSFKILISGVMSLVFGTLIYIIGVFVLLFVLMAIGTAGINLPLGEIFTFYNAYGFKIIFTILFLWLVTGKEKF